LVFVHNLSTTNARKPIKGSDFRLFYFKRTKENVASWGWGQWSTDMEILQSWSNPNFFIDSIYNPYPKLLNQLHISQYNWYNW